MDDLDQKSAKLINQQSLLSDGDTMIADEIVKIGKRGQITLPTNMRESENLKEGDYLDISDVGGVITLRKVEKKPSVIDLFKEVGEALVKEGITTKEKAQKLADSIKKGNK